MANKRLVDVGMLALTSQAAVTTQIGGLISLNTSPFFTNTTSSPASGAYGVEEFDATGLAFTGGFSSNDLANIITALAASDEGSQALQYLCHESGAATYLTEVLAAAYIHSFGMNISTTSPATCNVGWELDAQGDEATIGMLLAAMAVPTAAQSAVNIAAATPAFTQTLPVRYIRPHTMTFTPYGGAAISPIHLMNFSMNVSAPVKRAHEDDTLGNAIDIGSWGLGTCSVTFRDATVATGTYIASKLIAVRQGVLAFACHKMTDDGAASITLQGVKFHSVTKNDSAEHTTFTVNGSFTWLSHGLTPDVAYTWATMLVLG